MTEEKEEEGLTLDKKTMDVLVANIIPTSKYFEIRFDHKHFHSRGAGRLLEVTWCVLRFWSGLKKKTSFRKD